MQVTFKDSVPAFWIIPSPLNNEVSQFPGTPLCSVMPPRSNASGLCFQLLPWPLSNYFSQFEIPPLSFSSSSFSVFFFELSLDFPNQSLFLRSRRILQLKQIITIYSENRKKRHCPHKKQSHSMFKSSRMTLCHCAFRSKFNL